MPRNPNLPPNEITDFERALAQLGSSSIWIKAKFLKMCKEATKSAEFKEMHRSLGPAQKKLAGAIFGKTEDENEGEDAVYPRPIPPILSGRGGTLPLEKIFEQVDPIDLFNFASLSKRCQALLETLKINVESVEVENRECLLYRLGPAFHKRRERRYLLKFKMFNQPKKFIVKVNTSRETVQDSRRNGRTRKFGDCEFVVRSPKNDKEDADRVFSCIDDTAALEFAKVVSRFYLKIYKTHNVSLLAFESSKDYTVYFINHITRRFKDFDISYNLTEAESLLVLEDLEISGRFKCCLSLSFKYDKPFQYNHMVISMKVNIDNLINMKCERLEMCKPLSIDDVKAFVQNWMNGSMPHLENFEFKVRSKNSKGDQLKEQIETSLKPLGVTKAEESIYCKSLRVPGNDGRVAFLQISLSRFLEIELRFCCGPLK